MLITSITTALGFAAGMATMAWKPKPDDPAEPSSDPEAGTEDGGGSPDDPEEDPADGKKPPAGLAAFSSIVGVLGGVGTEINAQLLVPEDPTWTHVGDLER